MPVGGTRSTFGSQTSSRRSSAPSYGFGSGTREVASKVFVSQEHAKLETGKGVPGPATYTLTASVAKQESSTKASAPNYGFGTGERWMKPSKDTAPGPGQYDMTGGVGPQTSSARTSAPKYGFGSATREHVEKVYIEEEFNKADFGRNSPGPCAPYQTTNAIGKQVLSGKAGQPTWVIGNAERFSMDHVKRSAGAPGPGAYALPAAVGPQVASTKPSTPHSRLWYEKAFDLLYKKGDGRAGLQQL